MKNKEILKIWEKGKLGFTPGHRTCNGCFIPTIVRTVLGCIPDDYEPVVSCATGCLEVTSSIWPHTSWGCSFIHNAFENTAATISGVESAYKALQKKGETKKKYKFIAFSGDGGCTDIGIQALSGALERGHDFLYILYDNEAYSNTGVQRSGATPYGANTTTTPVGKESFGNKTFAKDIMKIVSGHNISYLAQANPFFVEDFVYKLKKAFSISGPKFMSVLEPCTLSWKFPNDLTPEIGRLTTESNFWPLYEIEKGKYTLNYEPKQALPVEDFLKTQGRFKHLFSPKRNDEILQKIQKNVDEKMSYIKKMSEI